LETVSFTLRDCLGDALAALALRAQCKRIELVSRIRPDVPDRIVGDPLRLRQIVTNLVSNAIKFTECGEVVVEVNLHGWAAQLVELHVQVRDTGVGIPPDKLSEIFDAFAQVDRSTARTHGGTGLGLAISRKLIEMMNGRIWVESEAGRGSNFHFTAQFALPNDAVRPQSLISGFADGLVALVVDDNATSREALSEMLESWRMIPLAADSISAAKEAIAAARRPIDLALIDNALGCDDGFALARQLLTQGASGTRVIMLLSAGDQGFDVARCQEVGADAYVMKPVKQSELFDAIASLLGGLQEDAEPHEESDLPPGCRTILLVEDGAVNQTVALGLLEPRGHTVVVANNGYEALAHFARQKFDLVLMDVQMPQMDGFETTRRIRRLETATGAHTPIVAMTANAMSGDRERCLAAGMDAYLSKPIRKRELLNIVEGTWMEALSNERRPVNDSSRPRIVAPAEAPLGAGRKCQIATAPHVDWDQALKELGGDEELLLLVANTLLQEAPQLLSALRQAVADRDAKRLRLAAHTLKGSVSHLGAGPLVSSLQHLESAAEATRLDDVGMLAVEVEQGLAQLMPALADFVQEHCHTASTAT
jgi:two-component system sensor histidine kinase/response regulator